MFSTMDKDFLSMCMLYSVGDKVEGREQNEYFAHGGFLDFFNGDHRYVIRDCDATRKYLEKRGYSYNPSSNHMIAHYTLDSVHEILKDEGPSSYKYRKMLSFFSVPVERKTWDKLDQLGSFEEIYDGIAWLFKNDPYLSPFKEKEFLQTVDGKNAILSYALLNGLNYYPEINKDGVDLSQYEEWLKNTPSDYFYEILAEVAQKKNGKSH